MQPSLSKKNTYMQGPRGPSAYDMMDYTNRMPAGNQAYFGQREAPAQFYVQCLQTQLADNEKAYEYYLHVLYDPRTPGHIRDLVNMEMLKLENRIQRGNEYLTDFEDITSLPQIENFS